jgi:ABC-2 type transport system ATP-binding protein
MSVICKVTNVSKSFQPDFYKKSVQVLKSVNFQINEGRFVGFIGPNGAGKTTTIKCMMQFIFPDKGNVSFFEQNDLIEAKKRIGFLPERPYFQEFLTGMEFLKLHWDLSGLKRTDFIKRAEEVLEQVKLSHAKHKKLRDYSKGMLQRIGIAQALLASPQFLILDEPMSGLDPDGRILIKDILKVFKEKKLTVLMSSHLLEDVEELCDDLIILHKGETLFNGPISDFKHNFESLEKAYKAFKGQIEEVNYNA